MTNEQAVLKAEASANALKSVYYDYLRPLSVAYNDTGRHFTVMELLECQRLGADYFNALENFVANSDLLGAHDKGGWITNFAESCHSVLNSYLAHMAVLRLHASYLTQVKVEPDQLSMASLQRMVKAYCPKLKLKTQFQAFKQANLPTQGFTVAAHPDREHLPKWQLITCMVVGIALLLGVAATAIFIPNPTSWQGFVFRGIFALALSCVIAGVPGFMKMKFRLSTFGQLLSLVAGGSVVIFFVVWLLNPPEGYTAPGIQGAVQAAVESRAQPGVSAAAKPGAQSTPQ